MIRQTLVTILLALSLFFVSAENCFGQDFFSSFFGPPVQDSHWRIEYEGGFFPEVEIEAQDNEFTSFQNTLRFDYTNPLGKRDTVSFSTKVLTERYSTEGQFPDDGRAFPENLWDLRFSGAYKHRYENGNVLGVTTTLQSESDKPFHSYYETSFSTNLVYRKQRNDTSSWLFFLNYSTNRTVWNNIPIAGLGYWYQPNWRSFIIVGAPFLVGQVMSENRKYKLFVFAFVTRQMVLRFSYAILPFLSVDTSFEMDNKSYFLKDRQSRTDRFFTYEKTLYTGLKMSFSRTTSLSIGGGYAFDRYFFEGLDFDERQKNRVNIGDGLFIEASFKTKI